MIVQNGCTMDGMMELGLSCRHGTGTWTPRFRGPDFGEHGGPIGDLGAPQSADLAGRQAVGWAGDVVERFGLACCFGDASRRHDLHIADHAPCLPHGELGVAAVGTDLVADTDAPEGAHAVVGEWICLFEVHRFACRYRPQGHSQSNATERRQLPRKKRSN